MQTDVQLIVKKKKKKKSTYFAKVSDSMTAFGISDCHNVEEKWLDIVIQRFVIQEEFG